MKDLRHLSYFLWLEVSFDGASYYLSQAKYVANLLSKVGLSNNKTVITPLETNVKLSPTNRAILDNLTFYRQLIKSLIYLTVTQSYVTYVVHIVNSWLLVLLTL